MDSSRFADQVEQLARDLYTEQHGYLMSIARRNAHTEQDAAEALQEAFAAFLGHFDPTGQAPPLAWLTLTLKRQCWRQRRAAHLDLYVDEDTLGLADDRRLIELVASGAPDTGERISDGDDARRRLARLKPDERTALGMLAAGCSYAEIGELRGWTYTKVNRCIAEGRSALRSRP